MRTSNSTANIADALVRANLILINPTKDQTARVKTKTGADYSYSYVGLDTILREVRPVLQAHGLALVQEVIADEPVSVGVVTRLFHTSGEWIEFGTFRLPAGPDAQSAGSAVTYGRRYTLLAALGLAADEDDDGAKATNRKPKTSPGVPVTRAGGPGVPAPGDDPPLNKFQGAATSPVSTHRIAAEAGDDQSEAVGSTVPASPAVSDASASEGGPEFRGEGGDGSSSLVTFESLVKVLGNRAAAVKLINTTVGSEYNARTVLAATESELQAAMAQHYANQEFLKEDA